MKNYLIEEIEAFAGLKIWKEIQKSYCLTERDRVICIAADNELIQVVENQIDKYIDSKYIERVIIISEQKISFGNEYEHIFISFDKMSSLLRYLRIIDKTDQVIVISDKEPFGNLNLVGKRDISLDDYVAGSYLWRTDAANTR